MFRVFKVIVLLVLMGGIVYLGVKIYQKSSALQTEIQEKTTDIKDVAEKVADKAANTIEALLPQKQVKPSNFANPAASSETALRPPRGTPEQGKSGGSKPIDGEDKQLTTEILSNSPEKDAGRDKKSDSKREQVVVEDRQPEKISIEKINEIRELYSKAAEILNQK